MISMPRSPRPLALCLSLSLIGLTACSENQPVEPEPVVSDVLSAKGGVPGKPGDGGGSDDGGGDGDESIDPEVEATDPDHAAQDTTLDVRVLGTGFDSGSTVDFLLDGATTRDVKTNSTSFVSDAELRANITIDAEAVPDLYDVRVTTSKGKKGVGIELFEIVGPTTNLAEPEADSGPGLFEDGNGYYIGEFNTNTKSSPSTGNASYNTRPQCDEQRSVDLRLPTTPDGVPVWSLAGPYSDCQGDGARSQFHVPALLFADCADGSWCVIGTSGHQAGSSSFSPDLNYFFVVDTGGDGFGKKPSNETPHNVVWTDGEFRVSRRGSDGGPCRWEIRAHTAELWSGDFQYVPTTQALSLDAIVHRVDGSCAL